MNQLTASIDLGTVNAMDRESFVAALGATFEHSPWVAESAWTARPFPSVEALHAAMFDVVRRAPKATPPSCVPTRSWLAARHGPA